MPGTLSRPGVDRHERRDYHGRNSKSLTGGQHRPQLPSLTDVREGVRKSGAKDDSTDHSTRGGGEKCTTNKG